MWLLRPPNRYQNRITELIKSHFTDVNPYIQQAFKQNCYLQVTGFLSSKNRIEKVVPKAAEIPETREQGRKLKWHSRQNMGKSRMKSAQGKTSPEHIYR